MKTLWLDTIDSTNSEALRRLPELEGGTVLAAREQTAGRGQRGNTWFTEAGKNLTFSIVLKNLPLSTSEAIRLNYLTSVAVASFLEAKGVKAEIKWPNDIYVRGRKICGMLLENTLGPGGQLLASVIGIGINIRKSFLSWPMPPPLPCVPAGNMGWKRPWRSSWAYLTGSCPGFCLRNCLPPIRSGFTARAFRPAITTSLQTGSIRASSRA